MTVNFRVEGILGHGPDGPVRLAVPERLGARPVALRRVGVSAERIDRLRLDCETVAALGHPSLAVVEDVFEEADGSLLLATPVAEAGTLADRLSAGPLPLLEAVDLATAIADAVAAAHRAGLTHRRLHPGNVLIGDDGPLVTDLAQANAESRAGRSTDPVADDVEDVARLAVGLVDAGDGSAPAAEYRAACEALAAEPQLGLEELVARLRSIGSPAPELDTAAPPPVRTEEPPASSARGTALVLAASTAVGVLLGVAGTLLPTLG